MKKIIEIEGFYALKDLPKGEFFKMKPDAKRVYIRGEYDRSEKKYDCYAFDDMNYSRMIDGKKQVFAGFTF
jgi:hypothetical protein